MNIPVPPLYSTKKSIHCSKRHNLYILDLGAYSKHVHMHQDLLRKERDRRMESATTARL